MKKLLLIAAIAIGSFSAKAQDTKLFCYNTMLLYQFNGDEWVTTDSKNEYDCVNLPINPGTLEKIEKLPNGWIAKAYSIYENGNRYLVVYYFRGEYVVYYRLTKAGENIGFGYFFDKTKS